MLTGDKNFDTSNYQIWQIYNCDDLKTVKITQVGEFLNKQRRFVLCSLRVRDVFVRNMYESMND